MSEPVRLALVAEGPTDAVVVEAALRAILGERDFVLAQLQPEQSEAFGPLGAGWGGVYRWCKQSALHAGGSLGDFRLLLDNYDLLILQLDADVATAQYAEAGVQPAASDGALPCELPCPPPRATTDRLRSVLLSWCGEISPPSKVVLCTPSKSTDAWVVASLFPDDAAVLAASPFECHASPDSRLGQQPKRRRIAKSRAAYRESLNRLVRAWGKLGFDEAKRFEKDLLRALGTTAGPLKSGTSRR